MTAQQKLSVIMLMAGAFLIVGQLYISLPIIADIVRIYGVSPAAAALVGSMFGLAYALGFLISGPLADRFGRVRVIFYGMLAMSAATFLVAMAPSFSWLIGARIIQGACAASFPPAALALMAEMLPQNKRALGISLISLAFLSAAPLAQFIGALQSHLGITGIMLEIAPVYLVFAFIFRKIFKTSSQTKQTAAQFAEQKSDIIMLFADRGMIFTWLASATVLFGFIYFYSALQAFNANLHLNLQLIRLLGLPTLLLTLFAGRITEHYGAPVTAMSGLALSAAAFGLTWLGNTASIFAAGIILSAGAAFALPGFIGTVAARTNMKNRGFAMAVYSFMLFLGASAAAPLILSIQFLGLTALCVIPVLLLTAGIIGVNFARKPAPI